MHNRNSQLLLLLPLVFLLTACENRERTSLEAPAEATAAQPATPLQSSSGDDGEFPAFSEPKGKPRIIDFETDEGTWMSLDVSPDGQTIVFDMVGQIYAMPVAGGEAHCLTQDSGIALNFHPAFSPDGRHIAFISDRSGQDNVWIMDADGGNPRALTAEDEARYTDPEWHPNGAEVVAVRIVPSPGRGWHRRNMTLSAIDASSGKRRELIRDSLAHYTSPSFDPTGESLFFETAWSTWSGNGLLKAGHRMQALDADSNNVRNVRFEGPVEPDADYLRALEATTYAEDVPNDPPAELGPEVSPDGRFVAFGLERKGVTMEHRGHRFSGSTALVVRNLESGEESLLAEDVARDLTQVNAQYAYRTFPGYAWTPDSSALILSYQGKIHRIEVTTGLASEIPFKARVYREISEQVRGKQTINDETLSAGFIQWPASSPSGEHLAFVAFGQLWIAPLDGPGDTATAELLYAPPAGQVALTPEFSPGGEAIAFATWDSREGGHLWEVDASGGAPRRLSDSAAQYLFPDYDPAGTRLIVSRGPSALWPAFEVPESSAPAESQWSLDLLELDSGNWRNVIPLVGPQRATFVGDERVSVYTRHTPEEAFALVSPYPSETVLNTPVEVRSFNLDGALQQVHAKFPPRLDGFGRLNHPVLSPDGRWAAFESELSIYVSSLDPDGSTPPAINPDPNVATQGRVRVGNLGGQFPRWASAEVVDVVSGDQYLRYNAATGALQVKRVVASIPRDGGRGVLALRNARIITVRQDEVIENGSVVIENARITCVGQCDTTGAAHTMDLQGKTLIPGLFDLHAHHTALPSDIVTPHWPAAALDLAYGVTTIVDPATSSRSAFALAEMIEAGSVTGPRTYASGENVITQNLAWGDNLTVSSPENARFNAEVRARWGALELKNYRLASRQQHQYLIEAARDIPITVTAEGGPLYADIAYAMDGQTGWEHFIAPLRLYRDATEFFGRAGVHYSPTVIVAGHVNGSKEYYRQYQNLLEDSRYRRFIPADQLEAMHANVPDWPKQDFSFPLVAEGLADIVRAGGYGALGEHGEQPGIGSHWELWAYAEALTPLEALAVGTLHGAHFVGLDGELGSIEAGKLADIVVLNANPLDDITNTADIAWVIKAGVVYEAETLNRVWPETRAFGPTPWSEAD